MITWHQKLHLFRRIAQDSRGATAVEFAAVAPVMLMFILGMADALYNTYANSILAGAVQKAARDATLQGNNSATSNAALDARVLQLIRGLAPTATASSTRRSYPNFGSVATQEPFTDSNGDGDRDAGECYTDINGNSQWDLDPGINGDGGASDAILYTFTVTYPRSFPAYALLGGSRNMSITSSTILKNQPWADQSVPTPTTRCS
jgi:Flp pilus assembly protein TadG